LKRHPVLEGLAPENASEDPRKLICIISDEGCAGKKPIMDYKNRFL
jgi:hypothetical protein